MKESTESKLSGIWLLLMVISWCCMFMCMGSCSIDQKLSRIADHLETIASKR